MATVYRDYGALNFNSAAVNEIDINPRRQVYQATHEGGNILPFMERSFISFSYGYKKNKDGIDVPVFIEEFDLIASIVNNRINKDAYASFDDITTSYDNLDGQYYWNTHYRTNSLTFVLATDGIDQRTLEKFRYWFHAGEAKELILSEHPNRAIMARVAQPPELSLLPFEQTTYVTISGYEYPTKTTLYKGEITLTFVMDEPHWYAVQNVIGVIDPESQCYVNQWKDYTKDPPVLVDVSTSQDAFKVLLEDGIPLGSMIDSNMLLGNGAFANVEEDYDSKIWSIPEAEIVWDEGEPSGMGARIAGIITEEEYIMNSRFAIATSDLKLLTTEDGTHLSFNKQMVTSASDGQPLANEDNNNLNNEDNVNLAVNGAQGYVGDYRDYLFGNYGGKIAGAVIDDSGKGIEILYSNESSTTPNIGHFFYSGTAPSPTIISFSIDLTFNNNGYFNAIRNKNVVSGSNSIYNTITIESRTKHELKITTPNLFTSYNKALNIILEGIQRGVPSITIRQDIMNLVRHPAVRTWALAIIPDSHQALAVSTNVIISQMQGFFQDDSGEYEVANFSFNSKNGEAIGNFHYRHPTSPLNSSGNSLTGQELLASSYYTESTENIGDMLLSNNIFITDRNYTTPDGHIVARDKRTDDGTVYSHDIYHDLNTPLKNFQIYYRNMYL